MHGLPYKINSERTRTFVIFVGVFGHEPLLFIFEKAKSIVQVNNLSSQKIVDFLNKAISSELQVSIQYMWQHVQVTGTDGVVVEGIFRRIAVAEMKHAERLAERLDYLNGVPTTKPDPIFVGGSLIEMLKQNEMNEEEAITLYRQAIQATVEEGDFTTRRLLEEILAEEEEHINTFGKLLVGMTEPFTQPGTSKIE